MSGHTLVISENFFKKLKNEHKVLKLYGYQNEIEYIEELMNKLNQTYNFLNITELGFLDKEEEKIYKTFNGYVRGNFNERGYDEVNISFTDIKGKEGNTFLAQQFIPLLTNKMIDNPGYLLEKRILKIGILTTHKSSIYSVKENKSYIGSSIDSTLKCANTLGYQFISMFPILGINKDTRYYNADEFLSHLNELKQKNKNNMQDDYIWYSKKENMYVMEYPKTPKGQEQKFFALRAYTFLLLYNAKNIDYSSLCLESDITTKKIIDFIKYKIENNIILSNISNDDIYAVSNESTLEINGITYNAKGKKVYKRDQKVRNNALKQNNYNCVLHGDNFEYFISQSTNEKYVEGHHLIPFEFESLYQQEGKTTDVENNIVGLCPHCHAKIHYAVKHEKFDIINKLYNLKKEELKMVDSNIDVYKLAEMYNVFIV